MARTRPFPKSFLVCGTTTVSPETGLLKTWWEPVTRTRINASRSRRRTLSRLLVSMDESRGGSGSTRQIQPEAEYIKIALPEVDFGKTDKAEALIHRPGRLHHFGGVKHEPGLAGVAGPFNAKARQRLADALPPVDVVDGEQPDPCGIGDRRGGAAGSVLSHVVDEIDAAEQLAG